MTARIDDESAARPATRAGGSLPFGAVMATGAACQLASLTGLPFLHTPLLIVAIVIAVAVTVAGARRALAGPSAPAPLIAWLGRFTVPVGLGVIAAGLSALHDPVVDVAAWIAAASAVVSTVVVGVQATRAAHAAPPALPAVNGVWFIAPAAFLADAAACAALGAHAAAAPALGWIALASATIGTLGYAVLLVVAAVRVGRHGLAGSPKVAWWIVTGCGGLAAFALGRVAATFAAVAPWSVTAFRAAALVCAIVAAVVLVPIIVGCVRFLVGLPRRRLARTPWPPAFSSGVFALGATEIGGTFGWTAATVVGRVAAVETLAVWVAIAAVNIAAFAAARRSA